MSTILHFAFLTPGDGYFLHSQNKFFHIIWLMAGSIVPKHVSKFFRRGKKRFQSNEPVQRMAYFQMGTLMVLLLGFPFKIFPLP